jgi:hypothetical protein
MERRHVILSLKTFHKYNMPLPLVIPPYRALHRPTCEPPYQDLSQVQHASAACKLTVQSPTQAYGGTSFVRNRAPLGPYSQTVPRAIWLSSGGGGSFLSSRYPCTEQDCIAREITVLPERLYAECQVSVKSGGLPH